MSYKLKIASAISLVATCIATFLAAADSSAATPQDISGTANAFSAAPLPAPVARPLDADVRPGTEADDGIQAQPQTDPGANPAASLETLVAAEAAPTAPTAQLKCLAGAIYFESRSESLAGQLAVGRVIVARSKSGRFPASYCGVVYQPSQFSFVHGNAMPGIDSTSAQWQRAVAMARIADAGSWRSPAEGALFFHAARVAPGWRMQRVAQIDHQVFYR